MTSPRPLDAEVKPGAEIVTQKDKPRFGGWRKVHSAYDGEPQYEDLIFVMLPGAIDRPMRFAMVDGARGRLQCCLAVAPEPLDADSLKTKFNLPGPWITDLNNGWNESSTFRPLVYLATREQTVDPEFSERPGGLLVEAGPRLMARVGGVSVDGVDYNVRARIEDLPDGDVAIEVFTVSERRQPHRQVKIEVPYGTY